MQVTQQIDKKIKLKIRDSKTERNLSPALERNGSDDYLVVHSSKSSSNKRTNPKDPLENKDEKLHIG